MNVLKGPVVAESIDKTTFGKLLNINSYVFTLEQYFLKLINTEHLFTM